MISGEITKVYVGQILPFDWVTGNKEFTTGSLIDYYYYGYTCIYKVRQLRMLQECLHKCLYMSDQLQCYLIIPATTTHSVSQC